MDDDELAELIAEAQGDRAAAGGGPAAVAAEGIDLRPPFRFPFSIPLFDSGGTIFCGAFAVDIPAPPP